MFVIIHQWPDQLKPTVMGTYYKHKARAEHIAAQYMEMEDERKEDHGHAYTVAQLPDMETDLSE